MRQWASQKRESASIHERREGNQIESFGGNNMTSSWTNGKQNSENRLDKAPRQVWFLKRLYEAMVLGRTSEIGMILGHSWCLGEFGKSASATVVKSMITLSCCRKIRIYQFLADIFVCEISNAGYSGIKRGFELISVKCIVWFSTQHADMCISETRDCFLSVEHVRVTCDNSTMKTEKSRYQSDRLKARWRVDQFRRENLMDNWTCHAEILFWGKQFESVFSNNSHRWEQHFQFLINENSADFWSEHLHLEFKLSYNSEYLQCTYVFSQRSHFLRLKTTTRRPNSFDPVNPDLPA
jgi:hypothetical protein